MAHWPDREPAVVDCHDKPAIMIDRRSNLSPEECMGRYMRMGTEGVPVVVTDAQENWRAKKLWRCQRQQTPRTNPVANAMKTLSINA